MAAATPAVAAVQKGRSARRGFRNIRAHSAHGTAGSHPRAACLSDEYGGQEHCATAMVAPRPRARVYQYTAAAAAGYRYFWVRSELFRMGEVSC